MVKSSFTLSNITIENTINDEITLCGYPEDLKQVLMNLLNNAKDAIKGNDIAEGCVEFYIEKIDEKNALISFQDNGGGIPIDTIEKIFEPYFTTKHKSQGTGIGLYMSKRIVEERIEGSISVSNNEAGACFKIIIPITNSAEG